MAMDFEFSKWNRGLTSGLPIDSPLLEFWDCKNNPSFYEMNKKKIVHVLWLELCGNCV